MTNEKAITELSVLWERMKRAKESGVLAYKTIMYYDGQYVEALDMAIKALEILDRFEKEAYKQISFEATKDIDWSKVRLGEPIDSNIVIKGAIRNDQNRCHYVTNC